MFRTLLRRVTVRTLDVVCERAEASERAPVRMAGAALNRIRGVVGLDRIDTRSPIPTWDNSVPDQPMWQSDRDRLRKFQIDQGIIKPEQEAADAAEPKSEPEPEPTVKVYFKRGCPYTRAALDLLREREIPFSEFDYTEDKGLHSWVKLKTGRSTSPQILIHDEPIGGYDELRELDHQGELMARVAPQTEPEPQPVPKKRVSLGKKLPVINQYPVRSPFEEGPSNPFADGVGAAEQGAPKLTGDELVAQVRAVIDECRPMVQADGGDIELLDILNDEVVAVALTGNCIGCPSAQATLRHGIERRLRQRIPQITGISSPQLGVAG